MRNIRGKGSGIEARVDLKSLSSSSFLFGGWKFSDSVVCFDLAQNEISAWLARPFAAACHHELGRSTKGGFDNKRNRRIREHCGAARRFCLAENERSRCGWERERENYKRKRKCECVCVCLPGSRLFFPSVLLCVAVPPFTADGHSAIDNHRNIDYEIRATKEWYRGYGVIETVLIFLVKCKRWEPSPSTAPQSRSHET